MSRLTRRLLGLSEREVNFEHRGFRGGTPAIREHIETIGRSFLQGYHAALLDPRLDRLVPRLEAAPENHRGFVFEGAALALAILDTLVPGRRNRLGRLLADRGANHVYMAHVGAGWALARLPFGGASLLARLDPTLRWLAYDGWGFHQGFFVWHKAVEGRQQIPRRVASGYARRAFDQGLGRSLWFLEGTEVARIPRTIASFADHRQNDLWSGIGLAAAYAGGVDRAALETLRAAARGCTAELAQGAAFGAEARQLAGNLGPHTELACQVLCGRDAATVVEITRQTGCDLPPGSEELPDYEIWRQRLRHAFSDEARSAVA